MAWTGMSRVLILHRKMSDTHRQVPPFLSSCVYASSCVSIRLSVPMYICRYHVCDSFPRKEKTPDANANMCASTPHVTLPMKRSWSYQ